MGEVDRSVAEALADLVESNASTGLRGASHGYYRIAPDRAVRWGTHYWGISAKQSRSRIETWMEANRVRLIRREYPILSDGIQEAHGPMVTEHWEIPAKLLRK
jgi:hypothetical protein